MSVERVNYFDKQFLRVQEFRDEQAYQISMRRRHNISEHSWGIVQGLEPQVVDGSLWVSTGLAIDTFGRELVLTSQQPVPASAFTDQNTSALDVWLVYNTAPSSPAPVGYPPCGSNGNRPFYRTSETPVVRVLKPTATSTPQAPAGVLISDQNFDALQAAPEDRYWPVFLGRVTLNPPGAKQPYTIDLSNRPYAGLVGESVMSASGQTRLQVGMGAPGDPNRFAVFIPPGPTPSIAMDGTGKVTVQGETAVQGNLTVSGSLEIDAAAAAAPPPLAPLAAQPQPWRMYRAQSTDSNGNAVSELRIEIPGSGNDNNQVVFGAWSAQANKFVPCLIVTAAGAVTVLGNLIVKGRILTPGSAVGGAALSPAAQAVTASALVAGVSSGAALATPAPGQPGGFASLESKIRDILAHPLGVSTLTATIKRDFQHIVDKLKSEL